MSRHTRWLLAAVFVCGVIRAQDPRTSDSSGSNLDDMSIEQLMQVKVEGAALHPQTLSDAPASVTIITAEDIRKYGYRTLGEALASVRGFYITDNRTYETIGVRGFNAPGDYSSHVLIMVNGHNMTDNTFDYELFVGNDFPIDMNLIKQIEIIRGPSSALYGSNGIFATINIVTKTPGEAGPESLTSTFDSLGEKKGQVTETASIGKNAQVLLSGSVFNNGGQSPIYFPEFNTPQTNFGDAIDMNTERGYHLFSSLTWRNWSFTAAFSGDDKLQPISWGDTIFNNRGTQNSDTRDYIDAVYTRQFALGTLTWRTYYDEFHYAGRFEYPYDTTDPTGPVVEDNRTISDGKWIGSELTYRMDLHKLGAVTAGVEEKIDLRAMQSDQDVSPVPVQYLYEDRLDRNLALFIQDEKKLSREWTLDLGAREDKSTYLHDFFSPRAALIYQPRSNWTYKFLYGRSFRNPSPFQLFYGEGLSAVANPFLLPEKVDTAEFDAERKIGKHMNLLTAAYAYWLRDYLEGVPVENGLIQYQNVGDVQAKGVEVELNGQPFSWLEATASYALQRTMDDSDHGALENSPQHLAKLRFAVPVGHKLEVSSGMQYMSSVQSLAGATVPQVYLADFTLTSKGLLRNFDFRFGFRNAFNLSYSQPVALNPMVDTMPQPGRSIFVELIPHASR
jgi:outer membrane receptor for ferrienterochelin and colicins